MAGGTEADVHAAVADVGGPDTRTLTFLTAPDQEAALREDVQRIRSSPYLPGLVTGGFLYDVATGRIQAVC
jgi:carbonic anhydrase